MPSLKEESPQDMEVIRPHVSALTSTNRSYLLRLVIIIEFVQSVYGMIGFFLEVWELV